jgi:small multidrug resistance family-3 protein
MNTILWISLFIIAGVCEIGGSYLIWLWMREGKSILYLVFGSIIVILYSLIASLQQAGFGRTFALYGCFFIVLSLGWGWGFENISLNKNDIIGTAVIISGAFIIVYGNT